MTRVRLVSGGRRGQAILLEQRKGTQVRVNEAVIFDIPPFFMSSIEVAIVILRPITI
jgi:hypothetical protein